MTSLLGPGLTNFGWRLKYLHVYFEIFLFFKVTFLLPFKYFLYDVLESYTQTIIQLFCHLSFTNLRYKNMFCSKIKKNMFCFFLTLLISGICLAAVLTETRLLFWLLLNSRLVSALLVWQRKRLYLGGGQ